MIFKQLFDRSSCTYTYLLADPETKAALLIDPTQENLERDLRLLQELELELFYVLETHVHADHVTSASQLRQKLGAKTVLSASAGVGCADIWLEDGSTLKLDRIVLEARHTPGHTNGCVTYVDHINKRAFTGDTLLIRGCGRTDFQQGSSEVLYQSIHQKIFSLPPETILYPGHDYNGMTSTNVTEEMAHNKRLGQGKTEAEFCEIMAQLNLSYPAKIDQALPANMHCGIRPKPPTQQSEISAEWVYGHHKWGDFTLLDCREQAEWDSGHIDGATHLPMSDLKTCHFELNPSESYVVYCRSGLRSLEVVLWLKQQGYKAVSMAGGILEFGQVA